MEAPAAADSMFLEPTLRRTLGIWWSWFWPWSSVALIPFVLGSLVVLYRFISGTDSGETWIICFLCMVPVAFVGMLFSSHRLFGRPLGALRIVLQQPPADGFSDEEPTLLTPTWKRTAKVRNKWMRRSFGWGIGVYLAAVLALALLIPTNGPELGESARWLAFPIALPAAFVGWFVGTVLGLKSIFKGDFGEFKVRLASEPLGRHQTAIDSKSAAPTCVVPSSEGEFPAPRPTEQVEAMARLEGIPLVDESPGQSRTLAGTQVGSIGGETATGEAPGELAPRLFMTAALISLNVAVFLLMAVSGVSVVDPTAEELVLWGADFGPLTLGGQYWRLLSSTFVHVGALHLLFNMWVLYDLGRVAERLFGSWKFLLLYLCSGLGGSLASVLIHPGVVGAGASGAIFGVAGALVALVWFTKSGFSSPVLAIMQKRLKSLLSFIAYNLLYGFGNSGIDNFAHLGGLLTGVLMGCLLSDMRPGGPGGRGSTIMRSQGWPQ